MSKAGRSSVLYVRASCLFTIIKFQFNVNIEIKIAYNIIIGLYYIEKVKNVLHYRKPVVWLSLLLAIIYLSQITSCTSNIKPISYNEVSVTSSSVTVSDSSNVTNTSSNEQSVTHTTPFTTMHSNDMKTTNSTRFGGNDEQSKNVFMYTEQKSYPAGVEIVNVTIESRNGKGFGFDRYFELEKLIDSVWVKLPFKKDATFQAIWKKAIINPDTGIAKTKEDIELNKLQEKLTKGSYRILKKVEEQTVYAEFRID